MLKPVKKTYSEQIQKNLAGEYNVDLKHILARGLDNTTTSIWVFLQMIFVVFGISLVIATIYIKFQNIQTMEQFTQQHLMTLDLVIQLVIAPLAAAMMLQGANSHIKRLANVRFLFSTLPQALPICVVTGFILLLTKVGMSLFILPGLYLMIATSFAVLLVADKKLSPIEAIILSMKMVNRYLFPFTILYFLFLVLLVLSILSFGIGLLVLIPFYYNVNGLLYSELFGYGSAEKTPQLDSAGDSTFDA